MYFLLDNFEDNIKKNIFENELLKLFNEKI